MHIIDQYALLNLVNLEALEMNDVSMDIHMYTKLLFLANLPYTTSISFKWKNEGDVVDILVWAWNLQTFTSSFNSVKSIDLSGNKLSRDVSIYTMVFQQAKYIKLRDCQIIDAMPQTPLLTRRNYAENLDLGNNYLTQLPATATRNLQNLIALVLDHNIISMLSGTFLYNLISLQNFIISHNKISHIEHGFFSYSKLKDLDISYNEIFHLGNDILSLQHLNLLDYLDICGNPIDCSCGVWDTFRIWTLSPENLEVVSQGYVPTYTLDIDLYFGGCVACQSPYRLRGMSLLWYVAHPSCEVTVLATLVAFSSSLCFLFLLLGTICYSKWLEHVVVRKVNQLFRVQSLYLEELKEGKQKEVSVFVVFDFNNNEIADWIDYRLGRLVASINPEILLTIHGKDTSSGLATSKQAIHNIIKCRKTILFLSYDFCLEKNCR